MSWVKFTQAFMESSKLFHENVTPNLPTEIKREVESCKTTFSYSTEGKIVKLHVNGKTFDITEWYVPSQTIFDVYDKEKS